ncbi:LamG domain-containing protein [Hydrocarboniphaga sp.]|uniref:LamG domain-containing protein n=1 Tax=Hydrocarboniphaga sp. TaxID=2033016 RepID=UPI003D143426
MKYRSIAAVTLLISSVTRPAFADLDDGLVAYFPFDGNTADATANHNDGVNMGATLTTDHYGNPNSAYAFDGTVYISVPNSESLASLKKQYSVTAWVKVAAWTYALAPMICKGTTPTHAQYRPSFNASGYFDLHGGVAVDTSFSPALNTWYFIAATWNNGTAKVFVNGAQIGKVTGALPVEVNDEALEIGRDQPGSVEYLNGALDEIRIYNRTLSEAEITELYGPPPIGGSVKGLSSKSVLCKNQTSSQSVTIPLNGVKSWDCTAAGLTANSGDIIVQTVKGVSP